MLEYLRNAADRPVAKVLIGILAFSFIGWGVAEWIFGGGYGDTTLVRVGDTSISAQQFNNAKSQELARMSREEMRAMYADPDASAAFQSQILTKLGSEQMALNRAKDLGFFVSDNRIANEIREFPEFQENGEFSSIRFDMVLGASGLTESDFAAYLRSQILRSMVLGPIAVPMNVPQFAADALYNARYATRNIEYAVVKFSDFKAGVPTDEDLRTFYAQNPHTVPETRAVSYVLIPADMSKPDSYGTGYDLAVKVEDDIIAGESMADTAKKHKVKYVELPEFDANNHPANEILTDKMVARIFKMDAGAESELIETNSGFVIMRVNKITPEHNAEFDSVKNKLTADWARDALKKQAYVRANEILVELNDSGNIKSPRIATITRTGGAPAEVLSAAFNNKIGANTIVSANDAFYVLSIKSETKPVIDETKMKAVRAELAQMYAREITDDYNAFLIRTYPVKINERVYKRFFAQ